MQRIKKVKGQRLFEVQRGYPNYIQPPLEFFDPNRFREFEELHTNRGAKPAAGSGAPQLGPTGLPGSLALPGPGPAC
eukprot:391077-Heterocapsa_arctica.AAC.1